MFSLLSKASAVSFFSVVGPSASNLFLIILESWPSSSCSFCGVSFFPILHFQSMKVKKRLAKPTMMMIVAKFPLATW